MMMCTIPKRARSDSSSYIQSSNTESEFKQDVTSITPVRRPHYNLGSIDFLGLLGEKEEMFYIDKTLLIKTFFECERERVLVTAPRLFGKTINVGMLRSFLEIQVPMDEDVELTEDVFLERLRQTQNYKMFFDKDLKIMKETEIVKKHFGRYPVINCSFKCESSVSSYNRALEHCKRAISAAFSQHHYLQDSPKLRFREKENCRKWFDANFEVFEPVDILNGLETLSSYLYKHFEKRVFLLIDDYDGIVTQAMLRTQDRRELQDIIHDFTSIIRNALKRNAYECHVQWAFITGISCVGLPGSTVKPYRFLENHKFVDFYGLTSVEVEELLNNTYGLTEEQVTTAKRKYGGYASLSGTKIYNLCSFLEYASDPDVVQRHIWKNTNAVVGLSSAFRISNIKRIVLKKLLIHEDIPILVADIMTVDEVLDLAMMIREEAANYCNPNTYFSFLIDQGYLSYMPEKHDLGTICGLTIPNEEIQQMFTKEMITALRHFGSKHVDEFRAFFTAICYNRYGNREYPFSVFYRALEEILPFYEPITSEVFLCTTIPVIIDILTTDLGFAHSFNVSFTYVNRRSVSVTRTINHLLTKGNFAMILGYGHQHSKNGVETMLDQQLYKVFEVKDIVKDKITDYVLMYIRSCDGYELSNCSYLTNCLYRILDVKKSFTDVNILHQQNQH